MNAAERNFSSLVAMLRQQLALSQEDLARQLGVSFATVNRWENGHSKPSKLAQAQLNAFAKNDGRQPAQPAGGIAPMKRFGVRPGSWRVRELKEVRFARVGINAPQRLT